jgi:hypothetical protein
MVGDAPRALPQTTKNIKQKQPKPPKPPKTTKSYGNQQNWYGRAPGGPYQKQRKPVSKNNQNNQKH